MGYRIAVIGATGNVGREMLKTLAERNFPVDEVVALASARSVGRAVSFGEDQTLKIRDLASFDFKGFDIALSSPGAKISAIHSPRAAKAGFASIESHHFREPADSRLRAPHRATPESAGRTGRHWNGRLRTARSRGHHHREYGSSAEARR